MRASQAEHNGRSLRQHLRSATAPLHDRLDVAMRPPSDWQSRDEYAQFLSSQYQARAAVEEWLTENAPEDLKPPRQMPLLAQDLEALGVELPENQFDFALEDEGPATMIGAAWVLAGSSLGNRAMLKEMRRALPQDENWPAAFLSDTDMTQFWQALRPRIEVAADTHQMNIAVRAAEQVFDHFLTVAHTTSPSNAVEIAQ